VDLDTAITKVDRVVAYAYAEIESPGQKSEDSGSTSRSPIVAHS
jgi:hypothetical protein